MANTYFVVHNGLTVGNLSVDAVFGDVITSGNITAKTLTVTNLPQTQINLGIQPDLPIVMSIALG